MPSPKNLRFALLTLAVLALASSALGDNGTQPLAVQRFVQSCTSSSAPVACFSGTTLNNSLTTLRLVWSERDVTTGAVGDAASGMVLDLLSNASGSLTTIGSSNVATILGGNSPNVVLTVSNSGGSFQINASVSGSSDVRDWELAIEQVTDQ